MTAVVHHAGEDIAELRVALRFVMPFGEHCGGNLNVAAQLFGRMSTQEQAIEKGRLSLRKVVIMHDFDGHELWHRVHGEKCSLQKSPSTSSRTHVLLPRCCQLPLSRIRHRSQATVATRF